MAREEKDNHQQISWPRVTQYSTYSWFAMLDCAGCHIRVMHGAWVCKTGLGFIARGSNSNFSRKWPQLLWGALSSHHSAVASKYTHLPKQETVCALQNRLFSDSVYSGASIMSDPGSATTMLGRKNAWMCSIRHRTLVSPVPPCFDGCRKAFILLQLSHCEKVMEIS